MPTVPPRAAALKRSDHQKIRKRRQGLLKKARELSVLCNVDVCLICYATPQGGGAAATWPEDPSLVRAAVGKYVERRQARRVKECLGPSAFDRAGRILKPAARRPLPAPQAPAAGGGSSSLSSWPPELDMCSSETLASLLAHLESKISLADARMAAATAPDEAPGSPEVVQSSQPLPAQPCLDAAATTEAGTAKNVVAADDHAICDVDLNLSLGWPYC